MGWLTWIYIGFLCNVEGVATPSSETRELASDLVVYAARLVRDVRRTQQLPASTRILSVIDQHGALGVSQLAAADRSSQPSMSAAVNQLLAQGLVDKKPDPEDGRSQRGHPVRRRSPRAGPGPRRQR